MPPHIPSSKEIGASALSLEAAEFVRQNLGECVEHYRQCRQSQAELPTRLLDIALARSGFVKLIEPRRKSFGRYVALSYCWGDGKSLLTTKDTLQTRLSGVRLCELPRTIRDAVWVCRALDCVYLWVDCLCIIQDSVQDWQCESSQMGRVYANAFVTIAAASSSTADAGFAKYCLRCPESHSTGMA